MQNVLRSVCVCALVLWPTLVNSQMLGEKPAPQGGIPVGNWLANETPLQVYVDPILLAALSSLTFGGAVSGQLNLDPSGTYEADYEVSASVKLSLPPFLSLDTTFVQPIRTSGTFRVEDMNLILESVSSDGQTTFRDTLGYSVAGDSLYMIQKVPLGDLAGLVTALFPDAGPPLAVLGLKKVDDGGSEPIEITADFNNSGTVDFADFILFAQNFGRKQGEANFDAQFDLSGNQEVDFLDFIQFAKQFGRSG